MSREILEASNSWIAVRDKTPEPTCDINDLLLWCPDHQMGMNLVLGSFDGDSFTAYFEIDEEFSDTSRTVYPTHWMPAPHMGPDPKYGIWIAAGNIHQPEQEV